MSDELPPAPSESTEDATKAETIRITLPPKPEQPTAKRETVRINLPGKPAPTPPSAAPKKETTKIPPIESAATQVIPQPAPPPAPGSGKPFVPPPPKPPAPVGSGTLKPMSGTTPPPKPPSLGAKPTVPLKPAPAPSSVAKPAPAPSSSGVEPVTQKAAAPKKETARITLPPEGGKPALPKATIKMQQTQPLVKQPVSAATSQALQPAVALTPMAGVSGEAEPDGVVNILAIAALVLSLISLGLVFWAFSASSIS
jgi:hypothetical protein